MKIPCIVIFMTLGVSACSSVTSPSATTSLVNAASIPPTVKTFTVNTPQHLQASLSVTSQAGGKILVALQGQSPQVLTGINFATYQQHASTFFRLRDKNQDGFTDIGVLASADFGDIKSCYDFFIFAPKTQQWHRQIKDYGCDLR